MKLPYELFIARRYLQSRRKSGFINLITYISILGVAIGVAALIIVLSVMNGFESEVRNRIIGFDTHIRVRPFFNKGMDDFQSVIPVLKNIKHVVGVSPYILDKGMIRNSSASSGIFIRGADLSTLDDVSDLRKNIVYGDLELGMVAQAQGDSLPGIVVGKYIADDLLLDVGTKVFLFSMAGVTNIFHPPPVKAFIVTGFFETGFYEYDNTYVYISLESAQDLFRMPGKISGLEVRLDDLYKATEVKEEIKDKLGFPFYVRTWFEMRQNLFSWMQLEKWAMFIILCLIILVAAFNIISTLIMVVMEKTREIGILKSMGADRRGITRIFLYEAAFVGIAGTVLGFIVGFSLCWAQLKYKLISLPGDVYFITSLPIQMEFTDFLFIGTASFLICLISAVYPARRAAKLDPVKAIRYE